MNAVANSCNAHSPMSYSCRCLVGFLWDMASKMCGPGIADVCARALVCMH